MSWNKPYFENVPDGIYTVEYRGAEIKNSNSGKYFMELNFVCVEGEYEECPLNLTIWFENQMGENQLKGIVRKVLELLEPGVELTPNSHLEAGDNPYEVKEWLNKHLEGALCEIRVETKISQKDGKEYTNNWFHGIQSIKELAF